MAQQIRAREPAKKHAAERKRLGPSMERIELLSRRFVNILLVSLTLSGCSSIPNKIRSSELDALGVRNGVMYSTAEISLSQKGYSCFVSGASRENFDCTKITGFFPPVSFESSLKSTPRTLFRI